MIRSSNFGLVYVDSKGTTSTPRRSLSNPESATVQQSFHLSSPTSIPSRTFGSSNIANSANNSQDSPTTLSHRKTSLVKSDEGDEDRAYPLCEDIGDLITDDSELNQSDASDANWMHKIDVTQFKDIQQDLFPSQMIKNEQLAEDDDTYNSSISMRENIPSTTSNRLANNAVYQRQRSSNSYANDISASMNSRWMKPSYSYSCLVALALKNSQTGQLTVSEIYDFMCENFPYFRTAPPGWKNSVRHNLSLNKCFQKIELYRPDGQGRKSCLWSLNPAKVEKMNQEVRKWRERDISNIREALLCPDDLEAIEQGRKGIPIRSKLSKYSDEYRSNAMLRSNRPICPRPVDQLHRQQHQQSLSFSQQVGYERLTQQPPLKQAKMHDLDRTLPTTSQFKEESDTLKSSGEARRERVRSISVPQGGTLMIPEGCTVREVAAKNLQNLLENHSSRLSSYTTPVKNHSAPLTSSSLNNITNIQHSNTQPVKSEPSESSSLSATITTTTSFPQINQCVSPSFTSFTQHSPKNENHDKDTWYRTVLLSPLSPPPMTYSHNGTCPYDTVNSAINNNSLLKSALEQSPCRSLTFTSL